MRIVKGNKIYESFFDEVDDEEIVSSEMLNKDVIDDDAVDMRNFQHSAIFIYVIEDRDDLFDFQQNVKKFNNRLMHIINRTSVVKSDNYSLTIRFIPAEYQRVPVDSFETGAYKITKLNAKSQNLDHIFDWFINQSNRKNRMNFVIGYELKFDSYDDDSVTDILYDLLSINHASCVYLNSLVKNNVRNMFYFDNFPLRVHNNGYKIKTDSLEKFVDKFDKQSRRLNNIKKGYEIPEHFLDGLSDRVREKYMKILQNSRVVIRESQSLLKIEFKYEVSASVMVLIMLCAEHYIDSKFSECDDIDIRITDSCYFNNDDYMIYEWPKYVSFIEKAIFNECVIGNLYKEVFPYVFIKTLEINNPVPLSSGYTPRIMNEPERDNWKNKDMKITSKTCDIEEKNDRVGTLFYFKEKELKK